MTKLLALLVSLVMLAGCGSLNQDNIKALTTVIDRLDVRGSAVIDDPTLQFYHYFEQGVGVRIGGVHAQGSGQGDPDYERVEDEAADNEEY